MHNDLKYIDCARILRKNGFTELHQKGSHVKWERGGKHLVLKVQKVNGMIWRRLCKEHHLAL